MEVRVCAGWQCTLAKSSNFGTGRVTLATRPRACKSSILHEALLCRGRINTRVLELGTLAVRHFTVEGVDSLASSRS